VRAATTWAFSSGSTVLSRSMVTTFSRTRGSGCSKALRSVARRVRSPCCQSAQRVAARAIGCRSFASRVRRGSAAGAGWEARASAASRRTTQCRSCSRTSRVPVTRRSRQRRNAQATELRTTQLGSRLRSHKRQRSERSPRSPRISAALARTCGDGSVSKARAASSARAWSASTRRSSAASRASERREWSALSHEWLAPGVSMSVFRWVPKESECLGAESGDRAGSLALPPGVVQRGPGGSRCWLVRLIRRWPA
jgi:hypothetical protein